MTFNLLVGLLVLAALAGRIGRRLLARAFGVLALLLFLAVACGPLPRWLLLRLQQPYAATSVGRWAPRNAIVLLGAGSIRFTAAADLAPSILADGRILQAAMLYRDCKASRQDCRLLVSGGDSQHHGEAEAVIYAAVLRRLGVQPQDLQVESRSMNTWQNAEFTRPLLQAYQPQKLLLVTSGFHLSRSLLYFAHFGMRPTPVRGDQLQASLTFWPQAWNVALCDLALHEYVGMARFRVYNAMGWNAPPVRGPVLPLGAH